VQSISKWIKHKQAQDRICPLTKIQGVNFDDQLLDVADNQTVLQADRVKTLGASFHLCLEIELCSQSFSCVYVLLVVCAKLHNSSD
jgi:hypothetical protein